MREAVILHAIDIHDLIVFLIFYIRDMHVEKCRPLVGERYL